MYCMKLIKHQSAGPWAPGVGVWVGTWEAGESGCRFQVMRCPDKDVGWRLRIPGTSDTGLTSMPTVRWACGRGLHCLHRYRQRPEQAWLCPNFSDWPGPGCWRSVPSSEKRHSNLPWALSLWALGEVGEQRSLQHKPGEWFAARQEGEARATLGMGWWGGGGGSLWGGAPSWAWRMEGWPGRGLTFQAKAAGIPSPQEEVKG